MPYWNSRDQLSVADGVIYKGFRIVPPPRVREHMLNLGSHLGIVKSKQRAREVFYWPGLNSDIEQLVKNCCKCADFQNRNCTKPLKVTPTPELPYSEVGCDLFEFESKIYLIAVDYYSKYIDAQLLGSITTTTVITALKSIYIKLSRYTVFIKIRLWFAVYVCRV